MVILVLFLQWTLYLWGLIYLITQSTILSGPRVLLARGSWVRAQFLYCPSCVGFWVGVSLMNYWPFSDGWSATLGSAVAATAMGRIWGVIAGDNTFAAERSLLELPGDTSNDAKTES